MKLTELVEFSKCFSNESRIKIIKLLAEKELCVCELEAITGQTQSSISQHLRILYSIGLVDKRRDSQWIHYSLKKDYCQTMLEEMGKLLATPVASLEDFQEEWPRLEHLEENEKVKKCKGLC